MRAIWLRLITVRGSIAALGAIAALAVLIVALSPTVLRGETYSGSSLPLLAAGALGMGCLLRLGGGASARRLGTILIIVALVLVAVMVVGIAILVAIWPRDDALPTSLP